LQRREGGKGRQGKGEERRGREEKGPTPLSEIPGSAVIISRQMSVISAL